MRKAYMITILKSAQVAYEEWLYTVKAVKIEFDIYPNLVTKVNYYLIKSKIRKEKNDIIKVTNI